MDGPRAPLDAEFNSVVRFLDSHLRSDQTWSITSEYPAAFAPANMANIRIITDNNEVLSHAVMRPLVVKSPSGLFKAGAIGSVVTSSEHRNQGLSTRTIESCIEASRLHGCDFAILWTNLYDFYRRMGFELAGTEMSVVLEHELSDIETPSSLRFMDSARVAPEPIHRLYSQHTVSSLRTLDETRKYLQIPNMRVYTAWDTHGALKAYAIEGKGADLIGYVHEWGGSVSNLLPLFTHIRRIQAKPITIILPRHSQNLRRAFETIGLPINDGYLGMIKILNFPALFAKLMRHARSIGVADFMMEQRPDGKFYIGTRDEMFATDSEQDVVKLVFGPLKPSEIHAFEPAMSRLLDRVLPIDMWVWGWDSI